MSEIRVVDLTFSFGRALVLDRVSFVVPEGAAFVLLGPSGSGKTTLLRLIAGFLRPDAGEIHLGGRCVSSARSIVAPRERSIGMVFQSLALWPHVSAREHLRFAGARDPGAVLEAVGLGGFERRRPGALSGGEKQRLAIGRAVAADPRILLLDEPTSSLDPPYRLEMDELIARTSVAARRTVLLVTHEVNERALPIAGYLLLEAGRIYGPRPLEELVELGDSRYFELLRRYVRR